MVQAQINEKAAFEHTSENSTKADPCLREAEHHNEDRSATPGDGVAMPQLHLNGIGILRT